VATQMRMIRMIRLIGYTPPAGTAIVPAQQPKVNPRSRGSTHGLSKPPYGDIDFSEVERLIGTPKSELLNISFQ
jgi:hypothetical protein